MGGLLNLDGGTRPPVSLLQFKYWSKRITDGGLGAAAGRFFGIILEKNSYLMPFRLHFARF